VHPDKIGKHQTCDKHNDFKESSHNLSKIFGFTSRSASIFLDKTPPFCLTPGYKVSVPLTCRTVLIYQLNTTTSTAPKNFAVTKTSHGQYPYLFPFRFTHLNVLKKQIRLPPKKQDDPNMYNMNTTLSLMAFSLVLCSVDSGT
jgi:hypothetical protein